MEQSTSPPQHAPNQFSSTKTLSSHALKQTNLFRVGRYDDHSITGFTSSCEPLATFVVVLDLERDPRGRWSSLRHKYSGLMISRRANASASTTFQPKSPASQQRPTARAVSFIGAFEMSARGSGRGRARPLHPNLQPGLQTSTCSAIANASSTSIPR